MLSQINIGALIGRLQEHVLASAPGTMSETQVAAAVALLDRVLPDLYCVELSTPNLRPILVTWAGERRLAEGTMATHEEFGAGGSPNE